MCKKHVYTTNMQAARRKMVIIISALLVLSTLIYVEHPYTYGIKKITTSLGIIDSEHVLVGITDIRSFDHRRGNEDADTILIEYSDFGCVICAYMQENFNRIIREENILLVSRHLYLNTRGESFDQAIAAECVAKHQGEDAYFAFSEYIYKNQYVEDANTRSALTTRAVQLGVAAKDFLECTKNDTSIPERIRKDSHDGLKLGARGTPYIVVVHKGIPVGISYANEYDKFATRVKALVAQARN